MSVKSLSVVKIKDILLVTVPDDPGDSMISELQESVLNAIDKYQSKGVILDISMVQIMDSFFARTIAETTQMVSLMSGATVVAGMQPAIAITATELGLSLGNALSALDVDQAFEMLHLHLRG